MPVVHTSRAFEAELRELRGQALAMGTRCEHILRVALQAFWEGNPALAAEVPEIDAQIDRDEVAIHALVLHVLALRQPVAADLRLLTTAIRLITDLERIGDEAVNIAERAREGDHGAKALVERELHVMSEEAQDMLRRALQSFVQTDADSAEQVLVRDDIVDGLCASAIATMAGYIAAHSDDVPAGLRVVRVTKYLERVADHATNVAEAVIFMVRGDDVRHGKWQLAGTTAKGKIEAPAPAVPSEAGRGL